MPPQSPACVDHVVLCELGWVLERSYSYSRAHVHEVLAALLEHDVLSVESPALVRQALQWFAACPADFSDCPLAARVRNVGCETLLTLDRKAAKTATHRLLK